MADETWSRGATVSEKDANKYNRSRRSPSLGSKGDPTKKSPSSSPKKSPKLSGKPSRSPKLGSKDDPSKKTNPKRSPKLAGKKSLSRSPKKPPLNPKRPPNRGRSDSMEEARLDSLDKNPTKSPYVGPNPTKDRMKEGDPACVTYFGIRTAMSDGNDNVYALKRLLPEAVMNGQDFRVWPRQCLLLHGLVKQGCVDCVSYLVKDLGFDVNHRRQKDGCTPLHNAFYNLQGAALERMVHRLVELGADQNVKNDYGEPPCMFAFKAAASPMLSPMAGPEGGGLDDFDLNDLSLGESATEAPPSSPSKSIFTCNEKLNADWRQKLEQEGGEADAEAAVPPPLNLEVLPPTTKVEYSKQLPGQTPKTGKSAELYATVLKAATAGDE